MDVTVITENKEKRITVFKLLKLFFCLFSVVAALLFSERFSESVIFSLSFCSKKLIPTLFPTLVLSGILVRLGFGELFSEVLGNFFSKLTGLDKGFSAFLLLGMLFGAPTGASAVSCAYKTGKYSKSDAEGAVFLSSQFSPAFLVGAVGIGLLGNRMLGFYLYIIQIFSSLLTIILFFKKRKKSHNSCHCKKTKSSLLSAVSAAIKEAAYASVSISGSVVFFSLISGIIAETELLPNGAKALLSCFFELTSGAVTASRLLSPSHAFAVMAAGCGWSGISIASQVSLITDGELVGRKFFLMKAFSAVISAIIALILILIGII